MASTQLRNRVIRAVSLPAVFALGVAVTFGLRGNAVPVGSNANAPLEVSAEPPLHPPAQALEMQDAFEKVADKLSPSVVFIMSRQALKSSGSQFRQEGQQGDGDEGDNPSPFNFRFFGPGGQQFPFLPGNPNTPSYPHHAEAAGSGVIVRGDGYILTNDHVVQGADKVVVQLQDGREFTGKVMRDFRSDLSLVKIEAANLPAAQLADSDKVKVGEWAIAFGAPFQLKETMTVGVVSSLNREQGIGSGEERRFYPRLIQTDASINPGNSGGPLVDIYGRVIGINVAIESPSGGNVGIGFTIPANTARYVVDQLITRGSVTRGYLGVEPRTLTYPQQQQYGVKEGALVASVSDGTPAAKAGMQVGDVIVRYSGQPITDDASLRDFVARTKPGDTVPVVVRRTGHEVNMNVTVGTAPDLAASRGDTVERLKPVAPAVRRSSKLGVRVGDASNADVRGQLKLPANAHGVVIVEVTPGSPAAEAGLQTGDIIEQLNGKPIGTVDDLTAAVKGIQGDNTDARVRRGDQTMLVQISFE